MGARTSHLASSLYLLVLGLGIGLFLQVMVLIVQNTAARRDLGAATSSVNFARQIGSSIGVALIGALFIHRLDGQLAVRLPASGAGHLSAAQVSSITPQGLAHLPAPLSHVIAAAFADALAGAESGRNEAVALDADVAPVRQAGYHERDLAGWFNCQRRSGIRWSGGLGRVCSGAGSWRG